MADQIGAIAGIAGQQSGLIAFTPHIAIAPSKGANGPEADPGAADELLTDLFAVATWRSWPLPLEMIGERDLPVDDLPRGLLGQDAGTDGAKLWLLDDETLALSRDREADDVADMGGHPRSG